MAGLRFRVGGVVGIVAGLGIGVSAALGSTIVTNGDMESGALSGWTISNGGNAAFHYSGAAHTGTLGAALDDNGNPASMSQLLTGLTAGNVYQLDFWLSSPLSLGGAHTFSAYLGGALLGQITSAPASYNTLPFSYTTTVNSTSALLEFDWATAGQGKYLFFDDVSVTDLGPDTSNNQGGAVVPLPGVLPMAGALLGLLGTAAGMRRIWR